MALIFEDFFVMKLDQSCVTGGFVNFASDLYHFQVVSFKKKCAFIELEALRMLLGYDKA